MHVIYFKSGHACEHFVSGHAMHVICFKPGPIPVDRCH